MSVAGWKICRLGDLAEKITKGTTPTTLGHPFVESGINFIKAESILMDGSIDFTKFVFIDSETHTKLKRSQIEKEDLLFSMAGMVLGKTAVVKKEFLPANTNQALAIIRLKKNLVMPRYVAYFMRQKSFFNYVNQSTGQSAQPNINLEEIGNLEITLPDLPTQTRIAAILSALDDKIELNRQTNATLEAIAQAIFKEWCVDFRFPGTTGEMQDSELGPIPKGWRVGRLGELSYVQNGFAFKSKDFLNTGEIGIVKIKNINAGIVDIISTQHISSKIAETIERKFEVKPEALLIAMTGAEVGKIGLMPYTEKKFWLNQRVGMFIEKNENSNWFIYMQLSAKDYQETIRNSAVGSAQPNISGNAIESIKLLLPPEKIVNHFGVIVRPVFEKILYNIAQNHRLFDIRDNLLPKLMSGEIEV